MHARKVIAVFCSIVLAGALLGGCAWWQARKEDWVCPDHTAACECMNPDNGLGCQEQTDPNNPMEFGGARDAGADQ
jgi:hypothetical protein